MEFTNEPNEPNEPKLQEMRPMTLDYVRKELQKIGNPAEELVYYIWHLSNKRRSEEHTSELPVTSRSRMPSSA